MLNFGVRIGEFWKRDELSFEFWLFSKIKCSSIIERLCFVLRNSTLTIKIKNVLSKNFPLIQSRDGHIRSVYQVPSLR